MRFENEFVGLTVKEILVEKLGFSKRAVTDLKSRAEGIMLNGLRVTVRATVCEGDVLEINCSDDADKEKLVPSGVMPDVIYEDGDLIALNKPPSMPTHQSQGHFYDTLANSLAYYFSLKGTPFVFRSVNRLDRNTSGVVIVAKSRLAASKLSNMMKQGKIRKTYLAILQGELPQDSGRIETYIRRKEKSIILREVCDKCDDAKLALTEYSVLAKADGLTLVLASPITGRTHQLRVHFAHIGAQILGDDLYGEASPLIDRHTLHALKIELPQISKDGTLVLEAELPEDMARIIEATFGKEFNTYGRK